jgi:hypothetical protein
MEKITLELDDENYHYVLRQYGPEGEKKTAINMCIAQGREVSEENLYSCLSTLETDLREMFG